MIQCVVLATILAVVLAIVVHRVPRLASAASAMSAVGLTIPSFALLGLLIPVAGIGWATSVVAVTFYASLPILRNAVVGLAGVDRTLVEFARGMGMSRLRTLARIELPLAWPVTAVDPGPDTTTGPKTNLADAKAAAASLAEGRRSRPGWGLMIGQPLFVGLVVAGWAIWRNTAELDSIEQRQLQWAEIGRLTVQHLWLTLVATVIVLAVSVPLRIALTRKGLRRAGCTSDE